MLALMTAAGVEADTLATAEDLFAERAYAEAAELYLEAAEEGSAPAMMRLGLMADSGLGRSRSPEAALGWYRRAASEGLPDAMFNVAVMHDAGIGTERSPEQAYLWYSRAALRGHSRAQYNLGLLFGAGIGVPVNPALSRFWFSRASVTILAAAQKLDAAPPAPAPDDGSSPELLSVEATPDGVEVIWQPGGIAENRFLVELARPRAGAEFPALEVFSAEGSATLMPLTVAQDASEFRVTQIDAAGERYRSSEWLALNDGATPPEAQVLLVVESETPEMDAFVEVLGQDLAPQAINLDISVGPVGQTQVRYGFAQDADLARAVAGLLPASETVPVTLEPGLLPGRIALDIRSEPPGPPVEKSAEED